MFILESKRVLRFCKWGKMALYQIRWTLDRAGADKGWLFYRQV